MATPSRLVCTLCLAALGCAPKAAPTDSVSPGSAPPNQPTLADSVEPDPPPELADPASESLGGVSLGDSAAQVEAAFGPPTHRTEVVEWAATGDRVSTWTWVGAGLIFDMAEGRDGFAVLSMHIEAPCSATTSRGIGIGATFEAVEATYGEFRGERADQEEPEQWDATLIIVGSIFGGTFFEFEAGKVARIFVGAGAE